MKPFISAAILALVIVGVLRPLRPAAAGPQAASQGKPEWQEVTLTLTIDLEAGTRNWVATGAIEDSGTAATIWIQFGAINSPVVSVLQIDTLFTNADATGTFTIRRTILSTSDGLDLFLREGMWHVVDATGVYAGLRGHGKLTGTEFVDLVVDTLSGVVSIAD
jgi:hypothetical protein